MNAEGPVLRDIHVPDAAWWPPAPGWWLLVLVVLSLAAIAVWGYRRRQRLRPLRAALREIDRIEAAFSRNGDPATLAAECSRLLRRVALCVDPRAAASHGEAWRLFLHDHAGDARMAAQLDVLLEAPYRDKPALEGRALLEAVRASCRRALRRGRPRTSNAAAAIPRPAAGGATPS